MTVCVHSHVCINNTHIYAFMHVCVCVCKAFDVKLLFGKFIPIYTLVNSLWEQLLSWALSYIEYYEFLKLYQFKKQRTVLHYYFNVFISVVVNIHMFFMYLQTRTIFDILAFKSCPNGLFTLQTPHFSPLISPRLHSSMSPALPAYGNLLCLHFHPASSSLLVKSFRKYFEVPDFR